MVKFKSLRSSSKTLLLTKTFTSKTTVLTVKESDIADIRNLLKKYHLELKVIERTDNIPGSFWGDSEAGLISHTLYVRVDTPIHSLLHETCHFICMDSIRRNTLHTNAEGDYDEENAVCYLQILLSDELKDMDKKRMFQDMDTWGYSFRLGSAQAWFEKDAEDALTWLKRHKLLSDKNLPNFRLRM